jgi:hypothetical protein
VAVPTRSHEKEWCAVVCTRSEVEGAVQVMTSGHFGM